MNIDNKNEWAVDVMIANIKTSLKIQGIDFVINNDVDLLFALCLYDLKETLRNLIDLGFDPNGTLNDVFFGWNIVHVLADHLADDLSEYISYFIDKGVRVDKRDSDDETALSLAACNNNYNAVKVLLENGADPLSIDREGETPYSYAIYYNNIELVIIEYYSIKSRILVRSCSHVSTIA